MRVYLSADMEGVTGVVDTLDVSPGGPDYERGRAAMTEDVNAAVRAAIAVAPDAEILVNDAHGPMRNILLAQLHPAASLVRGKPKPMGMLDGLEPTHDAVVCIGFHSRAGTLGVLSHSFMGHEIEDMWLDDRPVGEIGLAHATAAALGVPVVALSGDDTACAEMAAWDQRVLTAAVKFARDRFAAELLPVGEAQTLIESTVTEALMNRQHAVAAGVSAAAAAPAAGEPVTLAVRWQSASVAAQLLGIPGVTARDARTVQASGPMPGLYRLFNVFLRVATALTSQPPYC